MRFLSTACLILLFCSPSLAQDVPDFSGVFLRLPSTTKQTKRGEKTSLGSTLSISSTLEAGSPFILVVRQSPTQIAVTALQNGAKVTSLYDLHSGKSRKETKSAGASDGWAQLKKNKLRIESFATQLPRLLHIGSRCVQVKESWGLSSDSQTLTVKRTVPFPAKETYARQESLNAALARARTDSLMNKCVSIPMPAAPNERPDFDYGGAAVLGITAYRKLDRCFAFDAGLSGDFFKGLQRIEKPEGTEFRRNGQVVSTFPEFVELEVGPRVSTCAEGSVLPLPTPPDILGIPRFEIPAEIRDLRFHVRWAGSVPRDLGEVASELLTEPWPELRTPTRFYRLQIRAKDVPLQDNLEIRILSPHGEQLGCICGHI